MNPLWVIRVLILANYQSLSILLGLLQAYGNLARARSAPNKHRGASARLFLLALENLFELQVWLRFGDTQQLIVLRNAF